MSEVRLELQACRLTLAHHAAVAQVVLPAGGELELDVVVNQGRQFSTFRHYEMTLKHRALEQDRLLCYALLTTPRLTLEGWTANSSGDADRYPLLYLAYVRVDFDDVEPGYVLKNGAGTQIATHEFGLRGRAGYEGEDDLPWPPDVGFPGDEEPAPVENWIMAKCTTPPPAPAPFELHWISE